MNNFNPSNVTVQAMSLAVGLALTGCVSSARPLNAADKQGQFVGIWVADVEFARWVISRHPDHSFVEKRIQIYDYAKPGIRIESHGKWRVQGGNYIKQYTETNHPRWKAAVGREVTCKILQQAPTRVEYLAEDGPRIVEDKIGNDAADLRKFVPLSLSGAYKAHPIETR